MRVVPLVAGFAALAAAESACPAQPGRAPPARIGPSSLAPTSFGACILPACLNRAILAADAGLGLGPPAPPPPPSPRRGREQPARAHANLVSLFSSDDYPAAAVRAGEQGAVGFRLEIDKAGRVAGCAITSSSGSAALDSTTCRLLAARARFTPARDRKGRAATDSVNGRIIWRIPEPEPPPPPPS
jgi:TonB family protein